MNIWKELKHIQELSKIQKILLGMLIIVVVMLVPESAFLLDAGGNRFNIIYLVDV